MSKPDSWVICPECHGEGKHAHAIDGDGITAEEWNGPDWSPEEQETYLAGGYDQPCSPCKGTGKMRASEARAYREQKHEQEMGY
jgi:hypothetical protein